MSDFGPGGMFDGLDDPTPPVFGGDLLPGVMQRGQHLRQQRRTAYAVGSACVAVLIAGAGIGIAGGPDNNGTPAPPLSPAPTASHSKKPPHHHKTESPNTTAGGTQGGGNGNGGQRPPKACVTPTPTPASTDATPSASPTPASSLEPTPWWTVTPPADDEPTSTPTRSPTPPATDCATPTPTSTENPMGSDSPTPTYSIPPLVSAPWHPWFGISNGIL